MALDVQFSLIAGRLTAKPELKQTAGGMTVLPFTVAVNIGYGEKKRTEFNECVAYGKTAEDISRLFDKGSEIIVTCHKGWRTRTWQDRNGQTRYKTEHEVTDYNFGSNKKPQADQEPTPQDKSSAGAFYAGLTPNSAGAFYAASHTAPNFEDLGAQDDLPF